MALVHNNITPIPESPAPDAVPVLWNDRYDEIDDNFQGLDTRLVSVEGDSHTHGVDAVPVEAVANEAALGTGSEDGEIKVCNDNGNVYTWDDGNSKWRVRPGNIYSSDPSSTTYQIEVGTIIYNTTLEKMRVYTGDWADTTADLPDDHLQGMVPSVNSTDSDHDIDFTAGACMDDGNDTDMVLASTLTKQIDAAWAAGNNAGLLDTGTVGSDTIYNLFAIKNTTSGVVDYLASLSTSPSMPSGFTKKRWVGWARTDGSANILDFKILGTGKRVEYWYSARLQIASGLNSTSYVTQAVSGAYPTGTGKILKVLLGGTSVTNAVAVMLSDDGTNMKAVLYASNATNGIGQINELFHHTSSGPDFAPINGNNVYYKVNQYSVTLYARAALVNR